MNRYLTFEIRKFHSLMTDGGPIIKEVDEVSSIHYDKEDHSYVIQGSRSLSEDSEQQDGRTSFPVTVTQKFDRNKITDVLRQTEHIGEQEIVTSVAMPEPDGSTIRIFVTEEAEQTERISGSLSIEVSEIGGVSTSHQKRRRQLVYATVFVAVMIIVFAVLGVLV